MKMRCVCAVKMIDDHLCDFFVDFKELKNIIIVSKDICNFLIESMKK